MSSIIKSISLDPESANIARRIPNFSKFVRECLKRYAALDGADPVCPVERLEHPLVGNHCIPAPTRICLKHWPLGNPRLKDWREFRHMIEYDEFYKDRDRLLKSWPFLSDFECPEEWIAHRAQITNPPLIEFDEIEISGNAKPKKRPPKRSFLQRIGAQLRGS